MDQIRAVGGTDSEKWLNSVVGLSRFANEPGVSGEKILARAHGQKVAID